MTEKKVKIRNQHGIHLRPCGIITDIAQKFHSDIRIVKDNGHSGDAKSIMLVAMLAILKDEEVTVVADGRDENEAVESISCLLERDFSNVFAKEVK